MSQDIYRTTFFLLLQYRNKPIVDSRMDSHEHNPFSQFERQPYVDLTHWRKKQVEYTEDRLAVADEELRQYIGTTLAPEVHETLLNTVLSHLVRAHMDQIRPIVQPGDHMRVKGNVLYDIYTQSDHEFESGWLEEGSELWGRFDTVAVRDYLDESIIDVSLDRLTDEYIGAHIRHFGTHLVLVDPVEIMPDGSRHGFHDCEALFIPLMYRHLDLAGHLSWER